MKRKLKILLVSPEVHPLAKTGGLADISSSLPVALNQLGHDVRIIMPKYKSVINSPLGFQPIRADIEVPVTGVPKRGFLFQSLLNGTIPVYLVENNSYFFRDGLYGTLQGDYPDNPQRFIFFCRAVLETCKALGYQPDIIHCNDWQTGLIPVYLKTLYASDSWYKSTRSIFSIHNLGYQGNFSPDCLKDAGLSPTLFTADGVEFYGHFSFMKAGLIFADLLTTVSPTYSKEIQTKEFGFGMEGILKSRSKELVGILNGVDYREWNPETDSRIARNYDPNHLNGKLECKRDLLSRFHLKTGDKSPVLCMITRLTGQKGIDLVASSLTYILQSGATFVILGTGDPQYEGFFIRASRQFPTSCASIIGFDEELAHIILAGSDLLLMPSQYEPCGLTQMYGLKYGTVPLVRSVGGLQDSVKKFNPKTGRGNGFKFKKYEPFAFQDCLSQALTTYNRKKLWRQLVLNGMKTDLSWDRAARKYIRLYHRALRKE